MLSAGQLIAARRCFGTATGTLVEDGGDQEVVGAGALRLSTPRSELACAGCPGQRSRDRHGHQQRRPGRCSITAARAKSIDGKRSGGADYVFSGGVASGTTVSNGGSEDIQNLGFAIGTIVGSGGSVTVVSGGVASDTNVSGGYLYVSSGGIATGTTIDSGATAFVFSGGSAGDTVLRSGGYLFVAPGGVASGTTGGGAVVSSGVVVYRPPAGFNAFATSASDLAIGSGVVEYVFPGGVALSNTIASSGIQNVLTGGAADFTTISNRGNRECLLRRCRQQHEGDVVRWQRKPSASALSPATRRSPARAARTMPMPPASS